MPPAAPIAIGLALTLIHLISIPVTNTSVDPARSTGPALFVGGVALQQLWLFWVAPIVGAAIAGRSGPHKPRARSVRNAAQTKNWPPFAEMVEPVMKPAPSDARNTTQRAISSASPRRPTGIWAMINSRTFSGTAMTISVAI